MQLVATKVGDGLLEIVLTVDKDSNQEDIKDFLWAVYEGIGKKAIQMDVDKDVPHVSIAIIGD